MSREFQNRKARRRWPLARQLADKERRARDRAHQVRYVPCRLKPADTVAMVHEEVQVIFRLRQEPNGWIKLWNLINELSTGRDVKEKLPKRQMYLAIVNRMLKEKKLIRYRPSNSLALAHWLAHPENQTIEDQPL